MSQKSLSTRSLLELVDLFDRSIHAVVDGDGQRLRGVPGWDLSGRLALSDRDLAAWTDRIGFAGSYLAAYGDERVPVDIEEDDDPPARLVAGRVRCPLPYVVLVGEVGAGRGLKRGRQIEGVKIKGVRHQDSAPIVRVRLPAQHCRHSTGCALFR